MSATFVPGRSHLTPCGGGAQQEGGGGPGGTLQSCPELPQLASDPCPYWVCSTSLSATSAREQLIEVTPEQWTVCLGLL